MIKIEKVSKKYNKSNKVIDNLNLQINDIWKHSLYIALGCENKVLDVEQYVDFNLQQYKKMLHIGMAADVSRGQLEFEKLKIIYMNKQRR